VDSGRQPSVAPQGFDDDGNVLVSASLEIATIRVTDCAASTDKNSPMKQ
jgi:hypothetical protein